MISVVNILKTLLVKMKKRFIHERQTILKRCRTALANRITKTTCSKNAHSKEIEIFLTAFHKHSELCPYGCCESFHLFYKLLYHIIPLSANKEFTYVN